MNRKKVALVIASPFLLVIFLIVLFNIISMFRTVSVGQIGIVTRYGRVVGEDPSGFHIIAPVDNMVGMNVQNQKDVIDAESATQDLQDVTVEAAINFNLTPTTATNLYKTVGVNYDSVLVNPIILKDIKGITSQYNAS